MSQTFSYIFIYVCERKQAGDKKTSFLDLSAILDFEFSE